MLKDIFQQPCLNSRILIIGTDTEEFTKYLLTILSDDFSTHVVNYVDYRSMQHLRHKDNIIVCSAAARSGLTDIFGVVVIEKNEKYNIQVQHYKNCFLLSTWSFDQEMALKFLELDPVFIARDLQRVVCSYID